jgi:hypothetical protein
MSGDGSNAIKLSTAGSASNGEPDEDEMDKIMLKEMPVTMWTKDEQDWYMIDGFRHPFQYTKGGSTDAVNPTYDLWSYGDDEENTESYSRQEKQDIKKSGKWITNWR